MNQIEQKAYLDAIKYYTDLKVKIIECSMPSIRLYQDGSVEPPSRNLNQAQKMYLRLIDEQIEKIGREFMLPMPYMIR
jgi:hypothetical protein